MAPPDGSTTPPPTWATVDLLTDAIREASSRTSVNGPELSCLRGEFAFGEQLDVRPVHTADFDNSGRITEKAVVVSLVHQDVLRDAFAEVSHFRSELYACLTARGDTLFELCDALLCTDGPVRMLVDLALAPQHRRGHGALYGGLNKGRVDVARLRRALAGVPLPRAADGRLVLAVDVSPWLRPDANTRADRAFCHTFGRGEGKHQMVPGWPYSVVAALETGMFGTSA